MELNIVYITAKDKKEARKIGRELILARLAACVNIIDNINSMYWWERKIQDDKEAILIAKTRKSLLPKLIKKAKSLHSYSCPCIISWPLSGGNREYLDWLSKETK